MEIWLREKVFYIKNEKILIKRIKALPLLSYHSEVTINRKIYK